MKLAAIGNVHEQRHIRRLGLGYHMALGQRLIQDGEYYKVIQEYIHKGHFVIVDNGAAEPPEERISFTSIAHAAMEMGADEIVLPDVIGDHVETVKGSLDPDVLSIIPQHKRFVVPQGTGWSNWERCLLQLVEVANPATIGVAKWLEVWSGGRVKALELIGKHNLHNRCHIHLLGIHSQPFAEVMACHLYFNGIRGIDTATPFAYAQNGEEIVDDVHYSHDWDVIGDTPIAFHNLGDYVSFINRQGIYGQH